MRRFFTIVLSILSVIILAGSLWWWQNGLAFLYGKFSPSTEQLIGDQQVPNKLSNNEWQADIDTLSSLLKERFIYFEEAYGSDRLAQRSDSVKRILTQQTRDQRILSIADLLNIPAPGTKHTGMSFVQRAINWTLLPITIYEFDDGHFIVDAIDKKLIGHEVMSIEEMPMDSVASRLAPRGFTIFAEPMQAAGIVDQINKIGIQLKSSDGDILTKHIEPGGVWSPSLLLYAKSRQTPIQGEWSPAKKRPRQRNYWFSYRDSTNLLYLQFNSVQNASDKWTITDLADSLATVADAKSIDKFVVDLRNNSGGNHDLLPPLVDLLSNHPKINQRGTLYTLTSPTTFSAAGTFALELERRTKTIFVGEPGGFATNMWGDTVPFILPNSKLVGNISYRYWQTGMPDSPRQKLHPDIEVPLTSAQHFSDVDSAMITVKQYQPAKREMVSLSSSELASFAGTYRLSPIHRARVVQTDGYLQLKIDRGRQNLTPFVESDLYPLSKTQLATDISEVFLEQHVDNDKLSLVWKDTTYTLTPVDSTYTLPIEDLRAGRFEKVAQQLRTARTSGFKLDGWISRAIMEKADKLEELDRPQEALPYAKLGVELFPKSWRTHSRLAYTYESLGQNIKAIKAYRKVRQLNPHLSQEVQEKVEAL